jgi:hypothetical protein
MIEPKELNGMELVVPKPGEIIQSDAFNVEFVELNWYDSV